MRRLAKEIGVNEHAVRSAVKEDLGLKSIFRVLRHLLTKSRKEKGLASCPQMQMVLCKKSTVRIFSDKKIFTVIRRNDRFIPLGLH